MLLLLALAAVSAAEILKLDFTRTTVSGSATALRYRDLGLPIYNDLPHQVCLSDRLEEHQSDYIFSDT